MFKEFILWLGRFVQDGRTGNPSVKRFGLALAVTVLCIIMGFIGGVIAAVTYSSKGTPQSIELVRIISGTLEIVAGLVLTAVTTGYIGGMMVNKKTESKSDELN